MRAMLLCPLALSLLSPILLLSPVSLATVEAKSLTDGARTVVSFADGTHARVRALGEGANERDSEVWRTERVRRESADGIPLNLMFFTSGGAFFNSFGVVPAVDMALENILRSEDVLSGYKLQYTSVLDSLCERTQVLDLFYQEILESPTQYLAVLGCGCSPASEPVAEIVHYYNLPMMSYISSSDSLSNRRRFPSYFRTDLTEINNPPAFAATVRQYKWKQVSIISQNENTFNSVLDSLSDELTRMDVAVSRYPFNSNDPDPFNESLPNMAGAEDNNYRVFILNMYSNSARQFICFVQKHKERLGISARYVFLVPGWYERMWWSAGKGDIVCTDEEVVEVINNSVLGILQFPSRTREPIHPSLGFRSADEFEKQYEERVEKARLIPSSGGSLAYDATWALAFAFNNTASMISKGEYAGCDQVNSTGSFVPLENFTYTNEKMMCLFLFNLQRTDFIGVSGRVRFNEQGTRVGNTVRIEQYRETDSATGGRRFNRAQFGTLTNGTVFSYEEGENCSTVWEDGEPPPDGTPQEQLRGIEGALVVIYYILSAVGLAFAALCLFFNVYFRNKKIVKLTSPNLNYLIIGGASLLYISVYFLTYPKTANTSILIVLCNFRFWLSSIGYTLCFSVILAKMGRVYLIFNNPTPNKKIPKDWMLLLPIALINAITIIILLIPTAISETRFHAEQVQDSEHSYTVLDNGIRLNYFFYRCTARDDVLTALVISYLLFLQLVAIFLSFHTRKVKVKALNDSLYVIIIIYLTSLSQIISAIIYFALAGYQNTYAALLAFTIIVTASLFLGLIFVPKMVLLYKDPDGLNVFTATNLPASVHDHNAVSNTSGKSGHQSVHQLERKVKELERTLSKYRDSSFFATSSNSLEKKSVEPELLNSEECERKGEGEGGGDSRVNGTKTDAKSNDFSIETSM